MTDLERIMRGYRLRHRQGGALDDPPPVKLGGWGEPAARCFMQRSTKGPPVCRGPVFKDAGKDGTRS